MKRVLAAPLLALFLMSTGSSADDQDVIDYRKHIMDTLQAQVAALGHDFDLKKFHDDFLAAGVIPISRIRWEMTGKSDQVDTMR